MQRISMGPTLYSWIVHVYCRVNHSLLLTNINTHQHGTFATCTLRDLGGLKPVHSNGSLSSKIRRRSSAGSNWAMALGLCHNSHNSHGDLLQLHSCGTHSPPHSITGGYTCLVGK